MEKYWQKRAYALEDELFLMRFPHLREVLEINRRNPEKQKALRIWGLAEEKNENHEAPRRNNP